MKTEQQSICPPYAQKTDGSNKTECKYVNKRKSNETVLAIARLIINDLTIPSVDLASICGIDPKNVSATIKKIQKKIDEGHMIIGLSNSDNEKLKHNLDLRYRNESRDKDKFLRIVAKVIIEYPRMAGSQIADRLNESTMNVSRAIKNIKKRLEEGSRIAGLLTEEHEYLKLRLKQRSDEAALEKQQREREKELAKAFREERKNRSASPKANKRKKQTTISAIGMAEWNIMQYDPVTGLLRDDKSRFTSDMPKRFPKKAMAVQLSTPDSYLIPGGPPPKGAGKATGRRRIGIMQLQ